MFLAALSDDRLGICRLLNIESTSLYLRGVHRSAGRKTTNYNVRSSLRSDAPVYSIHFDTFLSLE